MKPRKSIVLYGTRYYVGDRIFYVNSYNQQFYGDIVDIFGGNENCKPCLIVKRAEWYSTESVDPGDYIRSRHFPAKEFSR